MSLDVEMVARLRGRPRGRREEGRLREMRGLLDQPDQAGRIARHADDLQLVAEDAQLREVGVIGQELRQRLDDDDARGHLALVLLEEGDARYIG